MNKTIIFCLGICCAINCTAQQKPHYTQYILNQYIINPALSGIENYVDIKLSHRHQWSGLNGAPVTTYFTIQGPIGKKDYHTTATSFAMPGENPRGQRYWENYTAPEPHHGEQFQRLRHLCISYRIVSTYQPVRRFRGWHQPFQPEKLFS